MTDALAKDILERAIAKGATVTTAESCTGGKVAAAITDVAGSSAVFERGFITYSNAAKTDLLSVKESTLQSVGAVSEGVAREMANGAKTAANATVAVSITGIAGPGGSEHKPEGRVCFGLAYGETVRTETIEFGALGRAKVREAATVHALKLLLIGLSEV